MGEFPERCTAYGAKIHTTVGNRQVAVTKLGERAEDYARLFAAAPELLAALKVAHNGLRWYRDRHPLSVDASDDEADEMILAAIAKAEGRS